VPEKWQRVLRNKVEAGASLLSQVVEFRQAHKGLPKATEGTIRSFSRMPGWQRPGRAIAQTRNLSFCVGMKFLRTTAPCTRPFINARESRLVYKPCTKLARFGRFVIFAMDVESASYGLCEHQNCSLSTTTFNFQPKAIMLKQGVPRSRPPLCKRGARGCRMKPHGHFSSAEGATEVSPLPPSGT